MFLLKLCNAKKTCVSLDNLDNLRHPQQQLLNIMHIGPTLLKSNKKNCAGMVGQFVTGH